MTIAFSRRQFLQASITSVALTGTSNQTVFSQTNPKRETLAFFLVGDTHFLANKENPKEWEPRSKKVCQGLVRSLNSLPGTEISREAGGGKVLNPAGVIHAGDCIDTGDKANLAMQETEWASFEETYGLTGKEGQLQYPVYEVHGNHDSPRGEGLAVQKIKQRNKKRSCVKNVSPNGLHYSWDWQGVHFVNLGIVVGQDPLVKRKRRYDPLGSFDFLIDDLKQNVADSQRPVVITQHIDMLRYSLELPVEDKKAEAMEWDPADVRSYFQVLRNYNVAAVLYGHTHARNVYRWDGSNKPAASGVPSYNVDNSSHFASLQQAFFYFELSQGICTVREYQTKDGWETGSWTPQSWKSEYKA